MTEEDFLKTVIDLAHVYGWKVFHARAARTGKGWRTPVQGDGAGFPDLVLVRDGVIFAELKSEGGVVSGVQAEWIDELRLSGMKVFVWRPSDWEEIVEILKR